jgi:hypothetical protein
MSRRLEKWGRVSGINREDREISPLVASRVSIYRKPRLFRSEKLHDAETSSNRLTIWQLVDPKPITTEGDAIRFAFFLAPGRGACVSLNACETIKPPAHYTPQSNQGFFQ